MINYMSLFSKAKYVLIIVFICLSFSMYSQVKGVKVTRQDNSEKTRVLFIVDCSYNMYEKWQSDTKIKITQAIVSNIVDTLANEEGIEVALRVFGNEKEYNNQDCEDTHLLVPFYRLNSDAIKAKLKALVPKGTSSVAKSLEKAKEDFPKDRHCRNIVVMIVDNIDKCDGNIVNVSKQLQQEGAFIKPFVIGISKGMRNNYEDCGFYYEATNEIEFSKVMNDIIKQVLHNTTIQINLLDSYMETTETNIPMTFYDTKSKKLKYTMIHTFNKKGLSDTLSIDPLVKYDIIAHTIPPVKVENISINPGRHTIVPIKTPQGSMIIKYTPTKTSTLKNYSVIVRKAGDNQTINIQDLNKKEKYLVGKYDLEVLTLPRLNIENVEIGQSSTTTIEIPESGNLRLDKGSINTTGSIFVRDKEETKWVMNLDDDVSKENIDLMPGEYMVVVKDKSSTKTTDTIIKEFKIESNQITNVSLTVKK